MKKFLCLLLALVMALSAVPALAEEEQQPERDPEELIVGHPTITKGDFFTEMFGNDTADIDVRALLHGYNLVNWDQNQGVYVIDPTVVTEYTVMDDEVGNRTYYIALADDLCYSDGTPITAWDYAFSMLLMMSPEIEQIGGKIYRAEHLLGYDEYITKQVKGLEGVEVIDDYQLAVTLDHEFLPYFFETGLLLCVPYPISVIAPGCKVYDDGEGVYIGNEDQTVTEPIYTAELLKQTILDPETGYNSHPSVVSGPYTMISYDGVTAHFELNPYFKGAWFHNTLPGGDADACFEPMLDADGNAMLDADGNPMYVVKPTIRKIAFTVADNDTMVEQMMNGELDLVNKVTYGPTIEQAMETRGDDGFVLQNYPRIGLSFFTFTFENPTVHEMEVRQAIAWCMDRDQMTSDYCGAYGLRVDGYHGLEQWEYLLVTHQIDYPVNFIGDDLHGVEAPTRSGGSESSAGGDDGVSYEQPAAEQETPVERPEEAYERPAVERENFERPVEVRENFDRPVEVRENFDRPVEVRETVDRPVEVRETVDRPVDVAGDAASGSEASGGSDEEEDLTVKYKNRFVRTDEDYDRAIAAWESLSLDNLTEYTVDTVKANALLDSAGWTLNEAGETYQPDVDKVRCKMVDGELVALDLTLMYPEGNHIADTLQANFIDNLNLCGIQLTLVPTPMQDLLYSYYRETERTTDMIYLATNFHVIVDPAITYSTDTTANHEIWNNTYSDDEDLYYRAVNMRKTDPGDVFDYVSKWVSFQERYNEVLPAIPVYSNIYFDFVSNDLHNYWITGQVTWSQAILLSYFHELQLPETTEEIEINE